MNNLMIVHLVDSRKSNSEIWKYIETFKKCDGIYHAIITGGDPNFELSNELSEELGKRKIAAYNLRQEFMCSMAWYLGLKYFLADSKIDEHWYINVRDMDDIYDDYQMYASIKELKSPKGVVRFNHDVKVDGRVLQSNPYGKFMIPTELRLHTLGSRGISTILNSEPHMIHRQFALVNGVIVKDMVSYRDIYFMNKGEDTSFLMRAYVCSYLRKLPIQVHTYSVGVYNRDSGNMSAGDARAREDWVNRFLQFQTNIGNDCARFLSSEFPVDALPFVHEFVNLVRYERAVGNADSLRYHLRDCPR